MIIPNKEPSYPHFFHAMSPTEISAVKVTGDVEIGYIGFGSKGYLMNNYVQMFDVSNFRSRFYCFYTIPSREYIHQENAKEIAS